MIWYLTKGNHKWSIHPLVRAWLGAGGRTQLLVVLGVTALLAAIMTLLQGGLAMAFERNEFLERAPAVVIWGVWILWALEVIVDKKITRDDLSRMMRSPNVVLATRGEYIGGHPQLPHGRFVYLTLGGTLENPLLNIVLPRAGGIPDDTFAMPILDLQKTTQSVVKTGDETTVNLTLAMVTFRAKFLGEQATFNVEYIGQAGRKQGVEITRFLFGNGEIQTWHNYVICIQAEADTGQPPYGPWKSLPRGAPPVRDTTPVNPPVDRVPPRTPPVDKTPPKTPPADPPPPGDLPTANLPASGWKRLT